MTTKNLKGYTKEQRELAYLIRGQALAKLSAPTVVSERLKNKLMAITSPMFFIKYRTKLIRGDVAGALSQYQDDNYNRRAKFAARKG